jgi:rhomboid protease GluP
MGNLQEQLFPLATEWRLQEMPHFSVPEQLEDEEAVVRVLKSEVQRASETRHEKEKGLFFYGKPLLTYLILGVILAVFTIVEMYGSSTSPETLINFGAKFNPLICLFNVSS